ncbi:MAG: hypothetical protein J2P20_17465 [Pseudonocardia sp.]|nr:hypothetical protein [Pseudonocardia sp.]
MDVAVSAAGPEAGDQLRSLRGWLADVEELRGRVSLREHPPRPGTLGPVLDALVVAVGPGGAATAMAATVVAWLRNRHGEVRVKMTLPDSRSMELTAKHVAEFDAAALERQVAQIAAMLGQGTDGDGRPDNS